MKNGQNVTTSIGNKSKKEKQSVRSPRALLSRRGPRKKPGTEWRGKLASWGPRVSGELLACTVAGSGPQRIIKQADSRLASGRSFHCALSLVPSAGSLCKRGPAPHRVWPANVSVCLPGENDWAGNGLSWVLARYLQGPGQAEKDLEP